ncbi:MAG TPA: hypothetical protein VGX03_10775 [Candidatus Binatia bacterium]|nr:hypothetical protein [Candidatus Binatia bacterium]
MSQETPLWSGLTSKEAEAVAKAYRNNQRTEAANRRVGPAPEQRLRWLLDVAQRDLSALSPGQGVDLQDELWAFSFPGPPQLSAPLPIGSHTGPPFQFTKEYVGNLQKEVLEGMRKLLQGEDWWIQYSSPALPPDHLIYVLRRDTRGRLSGFYQGNYRSCFLMLAVDLLKLAGDRLRECQECQKLFLAVKRQAYCGPKCSQKARTRRYQATHKETLSERRHTVYERKVRQQPGKKNVKISHRKQKTQHRKKED